MDDYAGRVVGMTGGEGEDGLRVAIAVVKVGPGGVAPQLYELIIDADSGSMAPEGELVQCFDVYHEHEVCDDLNPTLRRLWNTARIADEITSRLLSSGALALVRTNATDEEE